MRVLEVLNPDRRRRRWLIKSAFLLAVTIFTLYPNPVRLVQQVVRAADMNALIQPGAPGLPDLEAQVRARINAAPGADPPDHAAVLGAVQRVVVQRLPYAFDWQTWGVANYFPTVVQALERGESDCKGRAVVAASVLARMGYQPRLVTDLSHVWVWTAEGETMSPVATASGRRLITADERGSRVDPRAVFSTSGLAQDMPLRIGFAVSVFPGVRTAIIAGAVWIVLLRRRVDWAWALVGAAGMAGGILTLKLNCTDVESSPALAAWAGLLMVGVGLVVTRAAGSSGWRGNTREGRIVRTGILGRLQEVEANSDAGVPRGGR